MGGRGGSRQNADDCLQKGKKGVRKFLRKRKIINFVGGGL